MKARRDRTRAIVVSTVVVAWFVVALVGEIGDALDGKVPSTLHVVSGLLLTALLALAVVGQPTR